MHFTDRILRYFPYKQHEKENNLASDPICLWLMSLYGYWLRILKLFLTFITYRLPQHLLENIQAPVPQVRLIIMCHKMVIFLSTYRLLSRLVFTNDPCFLWKINFKGKTNAFCKGKNHKTFSAAKQVGKIDRIVYIFFIFQRKLNRQKRCSHFLFNFMVVT